MVVAGGIKLQASEDAFTILHVDLVGALQSHIKEMECLGGVDCRLHNLKFSVYLVGGRQSFIGLRISNLIFYGSIGDFIYIYS